MEGDIIRYCRAMRRVHIKTRCESLEDCSICLRSLRGRAALFTPCGHCYHPKCIRKWLKLNATCPTCRDVLAEMQTGGSIAMHVVMPQSSAIDVIPDETAP